MKSQGRAALPLFVALALVAVAVVLLRWHGKPVSPVADEPAVMTNSLPGVGSQPTNALLAAPVAAPAGEAESSQQTASTNAAPPLQAQYARSGIVTPSHVIRDMLGLSDEQTKKLQPVLKRQQDQMNALRRDSSLSRQARVGKLRQIQEEFDGQLMALLTPEQAQKWQDRLRRTGPFGQQATNQAKVGWGSPGVLAERAAPASGTSNLGRTTRAQRDQGAP
jgi:hypothetical protein